MMYTYNVSISNETKKKTAESVYGFDYDAVFLIDQSVTIVNKTK